MLASFVYKCSSRDLEDKGSLQWLCKPTSVQQRVSAVQPKLFVVFLFKKFSLSKFELDSRLIYFYWEKSEISLWGEIKIDHFDLLHLA